jgi:UDP-GlcNAc:undecaprenyl-phosphate GlcNAc-1-phosphate transferase
MSPLALTGIVSFATTVALTPAVRSFAVRRGYLDVPNERSSHSRPTPRNGGWAIIAGTLAGLLVTGALRDGRIALATGCSLVLAALAVVDECAELPHMLRLIVQVQLAFLAVLGGFALRYVNLDVVTMPLAWLATPFAVVWIVGLTNGYNFMDGVNGIAAIEASVCGTTLALLFMRAADAPAAVFAAAVAGAALGFLPWNIDGSIFMGDSGSTVFGFLFAALVLRLAHGGTPIVAAALPLLPFLLDSGITIVRRVLRGEAFFSKPHRSHFYQRLQQRGWPHAAVSALYGLLAACGGVLSLLWLSCTPALRLALAAALVLLHLMVFSVIACGPVIARRT